MNPNNKEIGDFPGLVPPAQSRRLFFISVAFVWTEKGRTMGEADGDINRIYQIYKFKSNPGGTAQNQKSELFVAYKTKRGH